MAGVRRGRKEERRAREAREDRTREDGFILPDICRENKLRSVLPGPSFQQLAKTFSLIKRIAGLRVFLGGGGGGGHFILKRQRCLSEILKRTPERWGLKCFLLWTLIENYIRPEIQANYGEVHIQTDCLFSACHFYFSAPPKKVWLITQFPILHILFHCFEFRIVISVSSVARVP